MKFFRVNNSLGLDVGGGGGGGIPGVSLCVLKIFSVFKYSLPWEIYLRLGNNQIIRSAITYNCYIFQFEKLRSQRTPNSIDCVILKNKKNGEEGQNSAQTF